MRVLELAILLGAAIAPTFLLAQRIDADEFIKSGATMATVAAVYALWAKRK